MIDSLSGGGFRGSDNVVLDSFPVCSLVHLHALAHRVSWTVVTLQSGAAVGTPREDLQEMRVYLQLLPQVVGTATSAQHGVGPARRGGHSDDDVFGYNLGVGYGGVDAGAVDDAAVRPRIKESAFQDPTKHPLGADDTPPGWDDAQSRLRAPHVGMSRQGTGRGLVVASDDEFKWDAVGGGVEWKEALRLAAERADAIDRGTDAVGEGQQEGPAVDMGRQRGGDVHAGPPVEIPVIDVRGQRGVHAACTPASACA